MAEAELRPGRVLVADANPARRDALARLLRAEGHAVVEARDGHEALALLQGGRPDAAVLDTQLPGLSAFEVLKRSRGQARAAHVVLVAAPGSIREAVKAMKHGAKNYLPRPFAPAELSEALREALQFRPTPAGAAARAPDEHLRQAQKMEVVGRLAGGVAHDFNNLLTIFNGYAELLCASLAPDHPLRPYAEEILKAARQGAAVTHRLLAFSRKQVLQPTVFNLNDVVFQMEKMLRPLIGEHVELVLELAAEPCLVKADQGQVEQLLLNLAVNARDAMPTGGRLTVRTANVAGDGWEAAPPGRWVVLEVRDTGCGMDEATRARIFEPFFTTKEPGKGTGLGLATVQGIVEQSGGRIEVLSDAERGSTFTTYLPPAGEPAPHPEPAKASPAPPRGSETILVLEDDDAVRGMVRRVLEMQGYTVLDAAHYEAARGQALAHAGPIHLLVTDVVMPQVTGVEAARRLRQIRPGLRVLYMSGYADSPLVEQALQEEGSAALPKPFSADPLVRKVRAVLDRRP